MNILQSALKHKLITFLISSLVFDVFLCLVTFSLASSNPNSSLLELINKKLESQNKEMQSVTTELNKFKGEFEKLKKDVSKQLSFKEGLKFVLAFEGGLSDDEGDSGGLTNLGITHSEYDQYRDHLGLPRRSVAEISLSEATHIYKHTYWLNSGCAETPRRVALSCFDWQVNAGRGMSLLQQTLGGINVDGIFGSETENELDSWLSKPGNEDKLLHNYFDRREDAYRRWGVGSQAKFLGGWLRRAEALKDYLKVP